MKKSPLVMSFISAIFAIAAALLLIFLPNIGGELKSFLPGDYINELFTNLWPSFKETISFAIERPICSGILVGLLAVLAIFWLWHFIVLIATKRANSLSINLFYLIFGTVSIWVLFSFIGYKDSTTGYLFNGTVNSIEVHNGFTLMHNMFIENFANHAGSIFLLIGIALLAALSFGFGLVSVIGALVDDIKNPKDDKEKEGFTSLSSTTSNPDGNVTKGKKDDAKKTEEKQPLIVQNITYSGAPAQASYPQGVFAPQQPLPPQPAPVKEEKVEKPALTEDDVRKIMNESLAAQQSALIAALSQNKQSDEHQEKKVEKIEERPLTAKELRSIIKNELRDHDHPEELLPLTDEQCRALIRDELDEYYASTRPQNEKAVEPAPVQEENPAPDFEEEFMTADELSKMIRNEVIEVIDENKGENEVTLETIKETIKEQLSNTPKETSITIDEISSVIKGELASFKENEDDQNKAIAALSEQYAKKEESDKLKEEETKLAIENLKASQLSADDIRAIISEELNKKLSTIETKPVIEEPAKEEPEPVVTETLPETDPSQEKAERVPFATRLLNLSEDIQNSYNELKEEALAYGLKSRLSISGDTFRLHTKTYIKMVVAGKGLKLYMALDPNDYKDSTIPVKDVGVKNLYKDIPLAFKVKSGLSLKRAKQLIKDVCEKDGLVKEEIVPFNYAAQLSSYRVAGNDEPEDIEEDEE